MTRRSLADLAKLLFARSDKARSRTPTGNFSLPSSAKFRCANFARGNPRELDALSASVADAEWPRRNGGTRPEFAVLRESRDNMPMTYSSPISLMIV